MENFRGFCGLASNRECFPAKNFLSYYKVFLGFKMVDSEPGSGPGLLRYFKPCRKDSCQIPLPNPIGPLSEKVDSAAIEEANKL